MNREYHGMTKTKIYKTWRSMMQRCYHKKWHAYNHYGGRGIKVCPEWHLFSQFFKDMGHRPDTRTLGRIDNDKDYSKSNCRWETKQEQNNNRCDNIKIQWNGATKTIAQWEQFFGLPTKFLYQRIVRDKMPFDEAVKRPNRQNRLSVVDIDRIKNLRIEGKNYSEIGRLVSENRATVRRICLSE